jgi:Pyridoxal-dependent decarboxylase, C-terminal sheet domain
MRGADFARLLIRATKRHADRKQGRGMAVDAQIRLRVPYGGRSPGRCAATWAVPGRRVVSSGLATDRSAGLEHGDRTRCLDLPCLRPSRARSRSAQYRWGVAGALPRPGTPLTEYAATIEIALTREFGAARPRIFIEPGRYLVGDAGLLRTEVLLISRKSPHEHERWVYLDAGLYNGLDETLNERIHYHIRTPRDGGLCAPVILAGPTCDSTDILAAIPTSCRSIWRSATRSTFCRLAPIRPVSPRSGSTGFRRSAAI